MLPGWTELKRLVLQRPTGLEPGSGCLGSRSDYSVAAWHERRWITWCSTNGRVVPMIFCGDAANSVCNFRCQLEQSWRPILLHNHRN